MSVVSKNSTEERALTLLGQGVGPEAVAAALGVSASAISQFLSHSNFATKFAELRYQALAKHNTRDNSYDSLEDALLEKMKDLLPFMVRPMEVLKAIQVINAAKRRGSSAPESITNQQTVITLNIPTKIVQHFSVNTMNQVIQAGQQPLLTVQSSALANLVDTHKRALTHVEHHSPNASPAGGH